MSRMVLEIHRLQVVCSLSWLCVIIRLFFSFFFFFSFFLFFSFFFLPQEVWDPEVRWRKHVLISTWSSSCSLQTTVLLRSWSYRYILISLICKPQQDKFWNIVWRNQPLSQAFCCDVLSWPNSSVNQMELRTHLFLVLFSVCGKSQLQTVISSPRTTIHWFNFFLSLFPYYDLKGSFLSFVFFF